MSHVDYEKWHTPCRYFCNFHVDFKIANCRLSNSRKGPCHVSNMFDVMLISPMSHVDFRKYMCRPVDFNGQGPGVLVPRRYGFASQLRQGASW